MFWAKFVQLVLDGFARSGRDCRRCGETGHGGGTNGGPGITFDPRTEIRAAFQTAFEIIGRMRERGPRID
jgi:hypothetical protein